MPNGSSRNLDRLFVTLRGFKAKHGHWPTQVRANKGFIRDLKQILTKDGYEKLASEVSMVISRQSDIRAEDDSGSSFTYSDHLAQWSDEGDIEAWLGSLGCADEQDDSLIFLADDASAPCETHAEFKD
jgi:hypothetical protein